jgi:hypothetical protein
MGIFDSYSELEARCLRGQCARRAIAKAKQSWSVIGWVTINLLYRAPPCFGRHVKSLGKAAFAVVSTHQPALGPRGDLWDINRLMMMMIAT